MSEHADFIPFSKESEKVETKVELCNDSIVQSVVSSFLERSRIGQIKYGTNLDRTDLKTLDWIQHAQEELMDGILYLEKLKQTIKQ